MQSSSFLSPGTVKLKSRDIFLIPGNSHMLCLGKLTRGLKEFWIMLCVRCPHIPTCAEGKCPYDGRCYIEEFRWENSSFHQVNNDEEITELTRFAELHKLTDIINRANEMIEVGLGHLVFR